MVAKAWSTAQKPIDEIFFQNEAVSLCLLINRRARTMRVIDFRAGPTDGKRLFVLSLAQREGVDKVYTLVERDEVQTWIKLGFAKEGNIPGFYKRSDAFLLGSMVPPVARGGGGRAKALREVDAHAALHDKVPSVSEIRLVASSSAALAEEVEDPGPSPQFLAAQARMERTIAQAKKALRDVGDKALPQAKVAAVGEGDARKAVAAALKSGRALTAFEPFGRDVERRWLSVTARGGFSLAVSIESQACFGNAFVELLLAPKGEAEKPAYIGAVRALCDKLLAEGTVSCFSLAPSDDVALACAFLHNGFRRTGLLLQHLVVGDRRKDAILWSRKLTNPAGE